MPTGLDFPAREWRSQPWAHVAAEVERLKKANDVVVLAHNYQRPEVQDVADYIGDSLGLAIQASEVDKQHILFCGVDFMAESAVVVNPTKRVIFPNLRASCPMAAMIDAPTLRLMKQQHPEAAVVAYVNTSAEVKVEADVCCTSSNAIKVVNSLPHNEVIMVPDVNLGLYVQRFTDKKVLTYPGYCHVHRDIDLAEVRTRQGEFPQAPLVVHPECNPELIDIADFVASTEGMIHYSRKHASKTILIATEQEMSHRLQREVPGKRFITFKRSYCHAQKTIQFSDVLQALETLEPVVTLPTETIVGARRSIDRMLALGRGEIIFERGAAPVAPA